MAAYEEIILLSILPKKEVYTIEYSCPIKGRGQSKHCPRPFLIRQLSSAFATSFWQVLNELEQDNNQAIYYFRYPVYTKRRKISAIILTVLKM